MPRWTSARQPALLQQYDQRQRVLPTIFHQSLPNPFALGLIDGSAHQRFPSQPRILPIRYRHSVVAHLGNKRGQRCLQRVRPSELRVVQVVSDDGEQIPETALYFLNTPFKLRQPATNFDL